MTTTATTVSPASERATATIPVVVGHAFGGAVATIAKAVASHSTVPVLGTVLIEHQDDTIRVTATDLESRFTAKIPVVSKGTPFAIATPAKALRDLLRGLTSDVALSPDENRLAVAIGDARTSLETLPSHDFPKAGGFFGSEIPTDVDADAVGDLATVQGVLARVGSFASTDPARGAVLGSVLVDFAGARLAATDGFHVIAEPMRSAFLHVTNRTVGNAPTVVLPVATTILLRAIRAPKRAATSCKMLIRTRPGRGLVTFSATVDGIRYRLDARTVDGQFPNIAPFTEPNRVNVARIVRSTLHGAVTTAIKALRDRSPAVVLTFTHGSDRIAIANMAVRGDDAARFATTVVLAEPYTGATVTVGLNPAYMADDLAAFTADRLDLGLAEADGDGTTLRPITLHDGERIVAQMPLRQ